MKRKRKKGKGWGKRWEKMQWEALHEAKISPEDRCSRRTVLRMLCPWVVLRILSLTCSYSVCSAPSLAALDSREESRCVKGWPPRAGASPSVRRSAGACRGSPSWDLARCLCAAVSGRQHPCFSLFLFLFSPQPISVLGEATQARLQLVFSGEY